MAEAPDVGGAGVEVRPKPRQQRAARRWKSRQYYRKNNIWYLINACTENHKSDGARVTVWSHNGETEVHSTINTFHRHVAFEFTKTDSASDYMGCKPWKYGVFVTVNYLVIDYFAVRRHSDVFS